MKRCAFADSHQKVISFNLNYVKESIAPKRKSKKSNGDGAAAKKARPERKTRAVYVTGLPPDATVDEIKELFEKYGLLLEDIDTGMFSFSLCPGVGKNTQMAQGLPKIKLYKDEQGNPKGDALITYFKPESVDLCVRLLDDSAFRYNQTGTIRVQPVRFCVARAGV